MLELKDWVAFGSVVVALFVACRGLLEFVRAQRWKRLEFVASQVKDFRGDPICRNVMFMLDYNARPIQLYPAQQQYTTVTDELLGSALTYHLDHPGYTDIEGAIRDSFDAFFDALERFEQYMKSGLVESNDFQPYLVYWVQLLADPTMGRKPEALTRQIWRYIDSYEFTDVQALCKRFGYPIPLQE